MDFLVSAVEFNWYGFLIGGGIIVCVIIACYLSKFRGLNSDFVLELALFTVPMAIVGARLYYVVFDAIAGGEWTFLRIIGFENGEFVGFRGLAIYGGLIGAVSGAGFLILYQRRRPEEERVSFFQMADFAFPLIILGQAIGRWGNFANQEAYGNPVNNPALQFFPYAVYIDHAHGYFQATFFYEFFWNIIGFCFLMWLFLSKRQSFDGFIFCMYCIFYGSGRFFIEGLRSDSLWLVPDVIRVSQVVSALIIIFGLGMILYHVYKARTENKKVFLFIFKERLSDKYLWYNKTLWANPLPVKEKKKKSFFDFFKDGESSDADNEADSAESGSDKQEQDCESNVNEAETVAEDA